MYVLNRITSETNNNSIFLYRKNNSMNFLKTIENNNIILI